MQLLTEDFLNSISVSCYQPTWKVSSHGVGMGQLQQMM